MANPITPNYRFAVTRLCDYLSTLPFPRAMRIWNLMPDNRELGDFATAVLAAIPQGFFERPPPALNGPRFVYENGRLAVQMLPDPDQQLTWPTPIEPVSGPVNQGRLPAPVVPARLRSLNSFMVFRSYVAVLFPGIPQKQKSPVIANLWHNEPLKAQWEILAKAYTILRDNYDVPDTSLRTFTFKAAEQLGIPAPREYLRMLGWEVTPSREELNGPVLYDVTCLWAPDLSSLDLNCLSVDDILRPYQEDPDVVARKQGAWPLENAIAIRRPTDNDDPLADLFDADGQRVDIRANDFSFNELYSEVDDSLVDPVHDLVYTVALEQRLMEHQEDEAGNIFVGLASSFPAQEPFAIQSF